MSTVLIVSVYLVQGVIALLVMYWLTKKYAGNKWLLAVTAFIVATSLVTLSIYAFILYAAVVLLVVLMARWLMAEWEHPKYGGIVLGIYFGFFISFPVGVYQYAH